MAKASFSPKQKRAAKSGKFKSGGGLGKPLSRPTGGDSVTYRGYTLGLGDLTRGSKRSAILGSFEAQIDLILDIPMSRHIHARFRRETIMLDKRLVHTGRAGPAGVFLPIRPVSHMLPVVLHELLHQYHERCLADGRFNKTVHRYFQEARACGRYELNSYMLSNVIEFFAMTASAVLHGRVARAPFTRRTVKEAQPSYFRWLVKEFGLRLGKPGS